MRRAANVVAVEPTRILRMDRWSGAGFTIVPSTNIPGNGQGWNDLFDLATLADEAWAVGHGSAVFPDASQFHTLVERSFLRWRAAKR
jgi:hypothetical protein